MYGIWKIEKEYFCSLKFCEIVCYVCLENVIKFYENFSFFIVFGNIGYMRMRRVIVVWFLFIFIVID